MSARAAHGPDEYDEVHLAKQLRAIAKRHGDRCYRIGTRVSVCQPSYNDVTFLLFTILRRLRVLVTYPVLFRNIRSRAESKAFRTRVEHAMQTSARHGHQPIVAFVSLSTPKDGAHAVVDLLRWSAAGGGGAGAWETTFIDTSAVTAVDPAFQAAYASYAKVIHPRKVATMCRTNIQQGPTCVWMSAAMALHLCLAPTRGAETQRFCTGLAARVNAAAERYTESNVMQPIVDLMFAFIDFLLERQQDATKTRVAMSKNPAVLLGWIDRLAAGQVEPWREAFGKEVHRFTSVASMAESMRDRAAVRATDAAAARPL